MHCHAFLKNKDSESVIECIRKEVSFSPSYCREVSVVTTVTYQYRAKKLCYLFEF